MSVLATLVDALVSFFKLPCLGCFQCEHAHRGHHPGWLHPLPLEKHPPTGPWYPSRGEPKGGCFNNSCRCVCVYLLRTRFSAGSRILYLQGGWEAGCNTATLSRIAQEHPGGLCRHPVPPIQAARPAVGSPRRWRRAGQMPPVWGSA